MLLTGAGEIQTVWETGIPNNTFQVLFFQLHLNKKYVKVAINDFTTHLIISKWLRRQKCRQKRKTMRQKNVEAKGEIAYESIFIYLKRNIS